MEMKLYQTASICLLLLMIQSAEAQDRKCIKKLLPCMKFLNGTRGNPPDSCCKPLKDVIKNMPECLCQMVSIKGSNAAEKAGIDINAAQMLPARCGQPVNYMGCLKGASSSSGYSMKSSSVKMLLAVASLFSAQLL
ncbi:non-specific lipid transfer protein GPI-anchored 30-like [Nicotiana tabacum]|uniref:Lipid transfer-like protein VAS n=2 Tax=Nicotiana TaxID=4085 RepID=A0A1S4B827_TOBAC|nr:PREDICTED: lipid transfer-like protein VAS [Nicotiana sylvestris]XP_016485007.1 PREDICTED: lipid transfer-like protein VAS [Nicotiana tabacum]